MELGVFRYSSLGPGPFSFVWCIDTWIGKSCLVEDNLIKKERGRVIKAFFQSFSLFSFFIFSPSSFPLFPFLFSP